MSRSYRKNDNDRRHENVIDHKRLRGKVRDALKHYDPDDDIELPEPEPVFEPRRTNDNTRSTGPKWNRGPDKREIE